MARSDLRCAADDGAVHRMYCLTLEDMTFYANDTDPRSEVQFEGHWRDQEHTIVCGCEVETALVGRGVPMC